MEEEVEDESAGGAVEGGVIRDETGAVADGEGDAAGAEDNWEPIGPAGWGHGVGGAQDPGGEGQGGEGGDEGDEEVGGGHGEGRLLRRRWEIGD